MPVWGSASPRMAFKSLVVGRLAILDGAFPVHGATAADEKGNQAGCRSTDEKSRRPGAEGTSKGCTAAFVVVLVGRLGLPGCPCDAARRRARRRLPMSFQRSNISSFRSYVVSRLSRFNSTSSQAKRRATALMLGRTRFHGFPLSFRTATIFACECNSSSVQGSRPAVTVSRAKVVEVAMRDLKAVRPNSTSG